MMIMMVIDDNDKDDDKDDLMMMMVIKMISIYEIYANIKYTQNSLPEMEL